MAVKTVISEKWKTWVAENVQRGVSTEALLKIMLENNFDALESQQIIANYGKEKEALPSFPNKIASGVIRVDSGNTLTVEKQTIRVLARLEKPVIIYLDNVLTHEECDRLISLTQKKLKPSKTVDAVTGEFTKIEARSSEGSYFTLCENDFIAKIDERIATLMHFPIENGEGIQVLHYGIGGEYKAHFDYFDSSKKGSRQQILHGGNRVATLIMYLNEVEIGGETVFPKVKFSVVPKKGAAVYFEDVSKEGQAEPLSLHAGAPVVAGEKWIATKWVRERRYG
jgi:prolyl 4-hydroxylase